MESKRFPSGISMRPYRKDPQRWTLRIRHDRKWHYCGIFRDGSQTSWRRFDIIFGLTEATAMPRHKGSKDLKPCAQQRAARPRGISLTEGIAHQPRREFIVSSYVRLACEKYLANPEPHHNPRGPIIRLNSAWDCQSVKNLTINEKYTNN